MAVDINRVVASAIEAAFDGESHHEPQRNRHRGIKALAAGAAIAATARVVSTQAPKLSKLGGLTALSKATGNLPDMVRDVPDRLRDRLADSGWMPGAGDVEDEGLEEDEDVAEDEDLDEDEDLEGDEEADDEDSEEGGGDWPSDEEGGDLGGGGDATEPEPEEEERPRADASDGSSAVEQAAQGLDVDTNGHRASQGEAPDVIGMLSDRSKPPPPLGKSKRRRHIDPVTRPPEPPTAAGAEELNGQTR